MGTHVKNVTGTIHALDGESLLTPQILEQIVQAVMSALDDKALQDRRAKTDTSVTSGVAQEQGEA